MIYWKCTLEITSRVQFISKITFRLLTERSIKRRCLLFLCLFVFSFRYSWTVDGRPLISSGSPTTTSASASGDAHRDDNDDRVNDLSTLILSLEAKDNFQKGKQTKSVKGKKMCGFGLFEVCSTSEGQRLSNYSSVFVCIQWAMHREEKAHEACC